MGSGSAPAAMIPRGGAAGSGGDARRRRRLLGRPDRPRVIRLPLFGPVASDATAFRLIDAIASDPGLLDAVRAVRAARARARARAWERRRAAPTVVIDVEAMLVGAHSVKTRLHLSGRRSS